MIFIFIPVKFVCQDKYTWIFDIRIARHVKIIVVMIFFSWKAYFSGSGLFFAEPLNHAVRGPYGRSAARFMTI